MTYLAQKPFTLCADGFTPTTVRAGDEIEVPARLAPGLIEGGFIAEGIGQTDTLSEPLTGDGSGEALEPVAEEAPALTPAQVTALDRDGNGKAGGSKPRRRKA